MFQHSIVNSIKGEIYNKLIGGKFLLHLDDIRWETKSMLDDVNFRPHQCKVGDALSSIRFM